MVITNLGGFAVYVFFTWFSISVNLKDRKIMFIDKIKYIIAKKIVKYC